MSGSAAAADEELAFARHLAAELTQRFRSPPPAAAPAGDAGAAAATSPTASPRAFSAAFVFRSSNRRVLVTAQLPPAVCRAEALSDGSSAPEPPAPHHDDEAAPAHCAILIDSLSLLRRIGKAGRPAMLSAMIQRKLQFEGERSLMAHLAPAMKAVLGDGQAAGAGDGADAHHPSGPGPRWMDDDETSVCMRCRADFTLFRRRHHCRSCGLVMCGECTDYTIAGRRTCLDCFQAKQLERIAAGGSSSAARSMPTTPMRSTRAMTYSAGMPASAASTPGVPHGMPYTSSDDISSLASFASTSASTIFPSPSPTAQGSTLPEPLPSSDQGLLIGRIAKQMDDAHSAVHMGRAGATYEMGGIATAGAADTAARAPLASSPASRAALLVLVLLAAFAAGAFAVVVLHGSTIAEAVLYAREGMAALPALAQHWLFGTHWWKWVLLATGVLLHYVPVLLLARQVRVFAVFFRVFLSYAVLKRTRRFRRTTEEEEAQMWSRAHARHSKTVLAAVLRLRGFWTKVGQYLGSRSDVMPPEWVDELVTLQDEVPAVDAALIRKAVARELGRPVEALFEFFDERPLGTASIAQVHRATLRRNASAAPFREVVIKVQHADVDRLMKQDLRNLDTIVRIIAYFEPEHDFRPVVTEYCKAAMSELDFECELRNMEQVRQNLQAAGLTNVIVPRGIPALCTSRVLVMELIHGFKITDTALLDAYGVDRAALVTRVCQAYAQQVFGDGLFNADPHPGNLLVSVDNGVVKPVLLDFGLMKRLDENKRSAFSRMVYASSAMDFGALLTAFDEMGLRLKRSNPLEDMQNIRFLLRDTKPSNEMRQEFQEFNAMRRQQRENLPRNQRNPVDSWPADLLFFFRVLFLLRALCCGLNVRVPYLRVLAPYARLALLKLHPEEHHACDVIPRMLLNTRSSNLHASLHALLQDMYADGMFIGLQVAAYFKGKKIVDTCAGTLGDADPRPVQPNSLFNVFSVTKALTAVALHQLVDRGLVRYDDPVATYWPEFAAGGKGGCTVEHVLTHRAGLAAAPGALSSLDLLCDWDEMLKRMAETPASPPPGHPPRYHALSFGWLVAGIVSGATNGQHIRDLVRDNIARQLGVQDELFLGLGPPGPASAMPAVRNRLAAVRNSFFGDGIPTREEILDIVRHLRGGADGKKKRTKKNKKKEAKERAWGEEDGNEEVGAAGKGADAVVSKAARSLASGGDGDDSDAAAAAAAAAAATVAPAKRTAKRSAARKTAASSGQPARPGEITMQDLARMGPSPITASHKQTAEQKEYLRILDESVADIERELADNAPGWQLHVEKDGVTIHKKQVPGSPFLMAKGRGRVPCQPTCVLALMLDDTVKQKWDKMYRQGYKIAPINGTSDIFYAEYKPVLIISPRDFVSVRRVEIRDDYSVFVGGKSVEHPKCPEFPNLVRGHALLGGYLMRPIPNDGSNDAPCHTQVDFLSWVDVRGSLPVWAVNRAAVDAPIAVATLREFVLESVKDFSLYPWPPVPSSVLHSGGNGGAAAAASSSGRRGRTRGAGAAATVHPFVKLTAEAAETLAREITDSDHSWSSYGDKKGVDVWKKKMPGRSLTMLRGRCTVQCSVETCTAVILDQGMRKHWDKLFQGQQVLERVGANCDVVRDLFEAVWPVESRDFVYARQVLRREDESIIVVNVSVPHAACPEEAGIVRGHIHLAGFWVKPMVASRGTIVPNTCIVEYLTNTDVKGVAPAFVVNYFATEQLMSIAGLKALADGRPEPHLPVPPALPPGAARQSGISEGAASEDDGGCDEFEEGEEESEESAFGESSDEDGSSLAARAHSGGSSSSSSDPVRRTIAGAIEELEQLFETAGDATWTKEGHKDGVDMFKKPLAGTPLFLTLGQGRVPCPPECVVDILMDLPGKRRWDKLFVAGRVVEKIDDDTEVAYDEYDKIFPVSGRDFVTVRQIVRRPDGSILIAGKSLPNGGTSFVPEVRSLVRATVMVGGFLIRPVPSDGSNSAAQHCHVSYLTSVDLGGSIPSFIMAIVAKEQPLVVANLRSIVGDMRDFSAYPWPPPGGIVQTEDGGGESEVEDEGEGADSRGGAAASRAADSDPVQQTVRQAVTELERLFETAGDATWTKEGHKDGVDMFKKPLPGSHLFYTLGRGRVSCPPDCVVAILADLAGKKRWDKLFRQGRKLETVDEHTEVAYDEYDRIFPVSGRDFVMVRRVVRRPDGSILVAGKSLPNGGTSFVPEVDGLVRGNVIIGGFLIRPVPSDGSNSAAQHCDVSYLTCVDPCGNIPTFIITMVAKEQTLLVANLQAVVAKMRDFSDYPWPPKSGLGGVEGEGEEEEDGEEEEGEEENNPLIKTIEGMLPGVPKPKEQGSKSLPMDPTIFNLDKTREACIPAANGHVSARAMARFYAALGNDGELDGKRILSPERVREVMTVRAEEPAAMGGMGTQWGLGLKQYRFVNPRTRETTAVAWGHGGLGGSLALTVPEAGLSVAVTVNKLTLTNEGSVEIINHIAAAVGLGELVQPGADGAN